MKSRFDADSLYSNNYLKNHGYAMAVFVVNENICHLEKN